MDATTSEVIDTKPTSVIKSKQRPFVDLLSRLQAFISIGDIFRSTFHAFIGIVREIDLSQCRVLVTVPNLNREIWVQYPPNLKKFLSQHQGNLVEFQGKIKLDKKGMPYKVKSLYSAKLADDSNVRVSDVLPANLRVKSLSEQFVTVELIDDKQIYVATYEELELFCYAYTRYELEEALEFEFKMDWENYAIAPDNILTPDAISLKNKLQSMFEEI